MLKKGDIYRKVFHLGNMIFPLGYWFFISTKTEMIIITGSLLLLSVIIDVFRLKNDRLHQFFRRWLHVMMKTDEVEGRFTGATWVMTGVFLTVILFQKEVAIPAMLFLSVGDSVAAIVGLKYGRIHIGKKTLEGSLAGFVSCLTVVVFYTDVSFFIRIMGAVTAMLVELFPIPIDDNVRIPVLSGAVMYGLYYFGCNVV